MLYFHILALSSIELWGVIESKNLHSVKYVLQRAEIIFDVRIVTGVAPDKTAPLKLQTA